MKKLLFSGLMLFVGWSCTQQNELVQSQKKNSEINIDSTEYKILIIDPDFDRWYMMRYSPSMDRSNETYRSMNIIGVQNWNSFYERGKYPNAIGSYLNYQTNIDYGLEVNRRLYWYFKYIEETYRIRLLR
ncbi:MAG: DUF6146 family protein [Lentimicrobium sp.]|jgi:hypothetical protein|nr:DUF6146 family protein [Lentimicrobium sp.]